MGGSSMMSIGILILLLVVMYFLMIRPQKKREKETNAMRAGLQVGDEIVTIGGICAKVVKTKEETIIVQVGSDKVKLEMMRWSVSKVVKEGPRHIDRAADDFDEVADAEENEARKGKPKRMKKAAPVVEEEPVVEEPVVEEAPAEDVVVGEPVEEAAEEVVEAAEEVVEAVEE
ncbi:MAG: preprotein translocase subunit YajC [Firmicutes bacterium]|nr:preprotein translocase subunit YajC [Bacillota bacterium]